MEVFVENFDEVVDCFQIRQVVVGYVDTDAEVETGVATVNDLEVPKLQQVVQQN